MKKVISIFIILALIFAFAGCAANNSASSGNTATAESKAKETTSTAPHAEETNADETVSENKSLVVYFSRTGEQYGVGVIEKGNTAIVADMIVAETGAGSFEIVPKTDNYPTTYDALTDYAKDEQNNNARPEIKDAIENFDTYDTIYLGYPIWWGDLPMICYTFLESYDFSGKTIIPFCTHAGSGDAGTQSKIQSAVPNATVKEVLAVTGTDAQNNQDSVKATVSEWLSGME